MEAMFANSKFNQDLSLWNVSSVVNCGSRCRRFESGLPPKEILRFIIKINP
ncbi:MAG: hypothetical protein O3C31_03550 [Bacteroidetes bacterium]|nr:hypothetical protein [Bacteroidota bacterium]